MFGLQYFIRLRHQEAFNITQTKPMTGSANEHDGGSAAIEAVFV